MKTARKINIGLIGLGTVGEGLVKALGAQRKRLRDRLGVDLVLKSVDGPAAPGAMKGGTP